MRTNLLSLFLFFAIAVSAQNKVYQDVLYLENGSIIRGQIMEYVPGKTVRIETADKSVFVFKADDVLKLVKEELAQADVNQHQKEIKSKAEDIKDESFPNPHFIRRKGYIGTALGSSAALLRNSTPIGFQLDLVEFGYMFSRVIGISASVGGSVFTSSRPVHYTLYYQDAVFGAFTTGLFGMYPVSNNLSLSVNPAVGIGYRYIFDEFCLATSLAGGIHYHVGKRFDLYGKVKLNRFTGYFTAVNVTVGVAYSFR